MATKDRNNTSHTKPSDIKKDPIRSQPSGCMLTGVITEFPTRGFSVLCSHDRANTGPSKVTVFVWTLRSAMDWRDKDCQSSAPKKAPVLVSSASYEALYEEYDVGTTALSLSQYANQTHTA